MNKNLLIIHFQDYGSCLLLSSYITYVKPNDTILPGSGHCKCIICCICKTVLVTANQLFWNFINILFVFRNGAINYGCGNIRSSLMLQSLYFIPMSWVKISSFSIFSKPLWIIFVITSRKISNLFYPKLAFNELNNLLSPLFCLGVNPTKI